MVTVSATGICDERFAERRRTAEYPDSENIRSSRRYVGHAARIEAFHSDPHFAVQVLAQHRYDVRAAAKRAMGAV